MDQDGIPELEDCSDNSSPLHHVEKSKTTSKHGSTERSEDALDEDTLNAFKKALQRPNKLWSPSSTPKSLGRKPSASRADDTPNWITDDLLVKIQSNPKISTWLQNPRKMSLLNELQKNPTKLFNQPDVDEDSTVIRQIAGILGKHFEEMAIQQENKEELKSPKQPKKPLIEEILTAEEKELQAKVDNVLANDKVRCALQDKQVRTIIETLRSNPEKGQSLARRAPANVKEKINLLIHYGVLAVK